MMLPFSDLDKRHTVCIGNNNINQTISWFEHA